MHLKRQAERAFREWPADLIGFRATQGGSTVGWLNILPKDSSPKNLCLSFDVSAISGTVTLSPATASTDSGDYANQFRASNFGSPASSWPSGTVLTLAAKNGGSFQNIGFVIATGSGLHWFALSSGSFYWDDAGKTQLSDGIDYAITSGGSTSSASVGDYRHAFDQTV